MSFFILKNEVEIFVNSQEKGSGSKSGMSFFKEAFIYGLMILIPIVVTIWFVNFLINVISGPVSLFMGHSMPVFVNFLITLAIILFVGIFARNILGRMFMKFLDGLILQLPVIRMIYKSVKQIIDSFNFQGKSLMSTVLIEYPRKGLYALGYVTNEEVKGVVDREGNDLGRGKVCVFVPTTPNPTSGFFLYVDKLDVIYLTMSVEDSVKAIMSAGAVQKVEGSL